MIEFTNVVTASFGPVSFTAKATELWRICLPNVDVRNDLTACLTGCNRPLKGRVTVSGKDIYEITEEEFVALFQKYWCRNRDRRYDLKPESMGEYRLAHLVPTAEKKSKVSKKGFQPCWRSLTMRL